MKIAIGSDHGGYELKQQIISKLKNHDYWINDLGCYSLDSVDYPDFSELVCQSVISGEVDFGILICGSANGVAMTANKYENVRAGLCWNKEIVELIKLHNDANILCIPARYTAIPQAIEMVKTFLATEFEGGRHQTRVDKIPMCKIV